MFFTFGVREKKNKFFSTNFHSSPFENEKNVTLVSLSTNLNIFISFLSTSPFAFLTCRSQGVACFWDKLWLISKTAPELKPAFPVSFRFTKSSESKNQRIWRKREIIQAKEGHTARGQTFPSSKAQPQIIQKSNYISHYDKKALNIQGDKVQWSCGSAAVTS